MSQIIWTKPESELETGLKEGMYVKIEGYIDLPIRPGKEPSYKPCPKARIWIHGIHSPKQGDWIQLIRGTRTGSFFSSELVENPELIHRLDTQYTEQTLELKLDEQTKENIYLSQLEEYSDQLILFAISWHKTIKHWEIRMQDRDFYSKENAKKISSMKRQYRQAKEKIEEVLKVKLDPDLEFVPEQLNYTESYNMATKIDELVNNKISELEKKLKGYIGWEVNELMDIEQQLDENYKTDREVVVWVGEESFKIKFTRSDVPHTESEFLGLIYSIAHTEGYIELGDRDVFVKKSTRELAYRFSDTPGYNLSRIIYDRTNAPKDKPHRFFGLGTTNVRLR